MKKTKPFGTNLNVSQTDIPVVKQDEETPVETVTETEPSVGELIDQLAQERLKDIENQASKEEVIAKPEVRVSSSGNIEKEGGLESLDGLSTVGKGLSLTIIDYMSKMDRNKYMDQETGVPYQERLYRTIRTIISGTSDEEFSLLFPALLYTVHKNRENVFHEDLINRFSSGLRLRENELVAYRRVMNMLLMLSDPATRKANLRSIDLGFVTAFDFTDRARQRVFNFFQKYK